MKCVLYARVSSKEQEKEGFSIPAQQKLLREYARKHSLSITEEFTDVETAKAAGRTQFGQMLSYLRSHPDIRVILVEKTDRLYRNFKDYVLLEELDAEIHLVKENEIISKDSRSHAKFIHGIKVLMAKNYIDNLSEEVKKGMREKAEQGEWPNKAPIGYLNNKTTHLVEADPVKAPLIVRLFELYASGQYSLKQLRDLIDAECLKSEKGRRLSISMIEAILKNPFYYGDFFWKGVRYSGRHLPLVSRELFNKVQEELHSSGKPRSHRKCFAFGGLLKCGYCGCSLVAEIKKGKYVYYHCSGGRGKCSQPYLREEKIDELLAQVVQAVQIEPAAVSEIVQALRESQSQEKRFRESEVSRLRRRHDDLQVRLDKSYEDRLDGVIDERYWRDVSAKWRAEQDLISQQISRFTDANRDYVNTAIEILELSQRAYTLYLSQEPSEKRKLLNSLLSNCELKGLTVYPTYRKPFDLIVEGVKMQFKLPRLDSNQRPAD